MLGTMVDDDYGKRSPMITGGHGKDAPRAFFDDEPAQRLLGDGAVGGRS